MRSNIQNLTRAVSDFNSPFFGDGEVVESSKWIVVRFEKTLPAERRTVVSKAVWHEDFVISFREPIEYAPVVKPMDSPPCGCALEQDDGARARYQVHGSPKDSEFGTFHIDLYDLNPGGSRNDIIESSHGYGDLTDVLVSALSSIERTVAGTFVVNIKRHHSICFTQRAAMDFDVGKPLRQVCRLIRDSLYRNDLH